MLQKGKDHGGYSLLSHKQIIRFISFQYYTKRLLNRFHGYKSHKFSSFPLVYGLKKHYRTKIMMTEEIKEPNVHFQERELRDSI